MPVDTLAEALQITPVGNDLYRARNVVFGERGVVFGGQLIAHITVAASRSVPDQVAKSVHAVFLRPVSVADDVELVVDVLHRGRTFSTATVSLRQNDRQCAHGTVLLTAPEPDLIRHAVSAPSVAPPEQATPRADPLPDREIRVAGGVEIDDADAVGPPELDVWIRYSANDDPVIRRGFLAHASASFLIGTAMRPHPGVGQSIAHRAISTGIIAHTVSFQEAPPSGEWMLLHQESTSTGNGRAHGIGHAFDHAGGLIATFSQESMIRAFEEGVSSAGRESTIL
jgi:acyl-CoA thioesterase